MALRKNADKFETRLREHPLSVATPSTKAAIQRRRTAAAVERVEKHAPVTVIQKQALIGLEEGFYLHLAQVDDAALSAASMENICIECCAVAESQLQAVRKTEVEYYRDLPRTHEQYRKLLAFEAALESEVVAWKIIRTLATLRNDENRNRSEAAAVGDIQADSEFAFVNQWTAQQETLQEMQALISVLEQSYAAIHPPDLSEAAELVDTPIRPRVLLDHELRRLDIISNENSDRKFSDEDVFKFIFQSLRAGDEDFAYEIARKGGLVLFVNNFKMRQFTKTKEQIGGGAKPPKSRLLWKQIALTASNDVSIGRWQRAVRGILCGNYDAVLPVAESWEDEAWIYFKCFLDAAFEKAIAQWRNNLGGEALSPDAWKNSFNLGDLFDRISNSANERVRHSAQSIFPLSIRAAFINDLDDAVVEIERFILKTSMLYPIDLGIEELQEQNLEVGSGVRFSLHVLLLMRRAGNPVEPILFGRACYLYVKTTTSRNAELWACYLSKIPDDQRHDAILHFFTSHLSEPKDKFDFLRAIAVYDPENTIAVSKEFVQNSILADPPAFTESDLEIFGGLFQAIASLEYGIAEWLLAVTNYVIRRYFLPDDMEIDSANEFFLAVKPFIDPFLEEGRISADGIFAKSEFICWSRYLAVCEKFSEWRICMDLIKSGTAEDSGATSRFKYQQEAILAGYEILSTTDWMGAGAPVIDSFDADRDQQVACLRGKTLGQVFCSLIEILQYANDSVDEKMEIEQLNTSLELSDHIMKNFEEMIGEFSYVEEGIVKVQDAANRISASPRHARFMTKRLKDKIHTFETAARHRFQVSSDKSIFSI
ncbi:hypothetical protein BV898_06402 [Hypsibius exemplaris]|uniref:Nuclear pore complex protein n=1 Tax=Hypsibius exemplaris TaxID=2072580 RepID=A0A1W0WWQ6_HYPEX|nr:hypothetical protein BV898_06402 [Hypsibius exemplaris]